MARGIFVCPKDLQRIYGYNSYTHAWNKLQHLKECIGKEQITINDFCQHVGISEREF